MATPAVWSRTRWDGIFGRWDARAPLDGTASSEGGYADQMSLGFLTNVSRASNPAGPIAADAGMFAVQTRHLRRRPGSRPRPQRHPLTLAVRRLPAGTGWMSRFGQVGSPASVYPRGHCSKARTLPSSITWSSGGSRRATAAGEHGGVGGSAGEPACSLAGFGAQNVAATSGRSKTERKTLRPSMMLERSFGSRVSQAARPAPRLRRFSARSAPGRASSGRPRAASPSGPATSGAAR